MLALGQAIRIGSLIKPQCYGTGHGKVRGGLKDLFREVNATCAWGAAHEAIGAEMVTVVSEEDTASIRGSHLIKKGETVMAYIIPGDWVFVRVVSECPKCNKIETIERLISHLNDDHKWKRERIADWVESQEKKQVTA